MRVESRGETTERASRGYTNATRGGSFPRRRDAGVEARVEVSLPRRTRARYRRRFRWDRRRFFENVGRFLLTAVPSKIYRVCFSFRLVPMVSCDIFSARGAELPSARKIDRVVFIFKAQTLSSRLFVVVASHARDEVVALRDVPHPPVRPVVHSAPRSFLRIAAAVDGQVPNLQSRRV